MIGTTSRSMGQNNFSNRRKLMVSGDRAGIRTLDLLIKRKTLHGHASIMERNIKANLLSQSNSRSFLKTRRNPIPHFADWDRKRRQK